MEQLLDYMASDPDATMRFRAYDIILSIHSDASYLLVRNGRSRACGHFLLGLMSKDGEAIRLNGAIFTLFTILEFVVASAAEAELGALFVCVQEGRIMELILIEFGHPQQATLIHCDNATAVRIVNGTVKMQISRGMEMRYVYSCDQVKQGFFDVKWHPCQENLGDYQSKHHMGKHHVHVRPIDLHMKNSPEYFPQVMKPNELRECVGNKVETYVRVRPLPVFPKYSSQTV